MLSLRARLLFYYIVAIWDGLVFTLFLALENPVGPGGGVFPWHFMFLTTWGGYVQTAYFIVCVIDTHKMLANSPDREAFHRHRDRFFGFAFAIGSFVGVGYWTVLYPIHPASRPTYGFLSSCAEHGMTLFFIWFELFLTYHQYAPLSELVDFVREKIFKCKCFEQDLEGNRTEAKEVFLIDEEKQKITEEKAPVMVTGSWKAHHETGLVVAFSFIYLLWNLMSAALNSFYPYPIQAMMPLPAAVIVYVIFPFFVGTIHVLGNYLNMKIWGNYPVIDESATLNSINPPPKHYDSSDEI
ncbi:hypothetical protein AAMO2058_001127100 [Amorphochlora amoebiformis]